MKIKAHNKKLQAALEAKTKKHEVLVRTTNAGLSFTSVDTESAAYHRHLESVDRAHTAFVKSQDTYNKLQDSGKVLDNTGSGKVLLSINADIVDRIV